MQDDTDEDDQSDVMVLLECCETAGWLPVACQPLMVCHHPCGAGDREEIPEAEFSAQAYENQGCKHQQL